MPLHSRTLTLQAAAGANGNGVSMDVSWAQNISVQVIGTFSATVNLEVSNDGGVTWGIAPFFKSDGTNATTLAAAGILETYYVGFLLLRARVSGYVSGNVTVVVSANG